MSLAVDPHLASAVNPGDEGGIVEIGLRERLDELAANRKKRRADQ